MDIPLQNPSHLCQTFASPFSFTQSTAWSQNLFFFVVLVLFFFWPYLLPKHKESIFQGKLYAAGLPKIAIKVARNHRVFPDSSHLSPVLPKSPVTPLQKSQLLPVLGHYAVTGVQNSSFSFRSQLPNHQLLTAETPPPSAAADRQPVLHSHALLCQGTPFLDVPLVNSHNNLIPRKCYCFMHRLKLF